MRTLTTILAVVLLMAAVAQANVLFDIGRHNLSVNPETDGKYWNNMPYANSTDPGVFMPVRDKWVSGTGWVNVGPCVDDAGNPSGVTMRSRDIPSNFATSTTLAPYPNNVIADARMAKAGPMLRARPSGLKALAMPCRTTSTSWPTIPATRGSSAAASTPARARRTPTTTARAALYLRFTASRTCRLSTVASR